MFWIFLLGIVTLMVLHRKFRKVALWILGGGTAMAILAITVFAITAHLENERIAAEKATQKSADRVVWLKKHPGGCAEFASSKGDDLDIFLSTDGNCWKSKDGRITDIE